VHRLRTVRLAALLVGLAMVAAACGGGDDEGGGSTDTGQIKEGGSLNYAADQEQSGFNINTSKDILQALKNITVNMYPAPFLVHPDFTVKLDSAFLDSAELTSQDPQTVVYKIKQNAAWSDGKPITADDFIYVWENCNGKKKGADCASTTGYTDIKSVEGSDGGKTVTTVYQTQFADWQSLFENILPSHYVKAQPGGWNTGLDKNPEKIPSGGAFVVESYTPGTSLTLKRNDKYFGPKAHLDSIVFRYLPESTTQPAALQNNEVDLIYPQPQLDMVQQIKALPDVTSQVNFGLSFEHLDFNLKNPLLADVNVRKAIATGINIDEVVARTVKQFSDQAQPLGNRLWVNNQPEYQDNRGNYGKGDVAGAEKLLQDAGYTKGSDGIYAKDGKKLSFRISTTAGNKLRETQEQLLQAQTKKFGVDLQIKNSEEALSDWLPNGNFDIINFAWVSTPFFSSNQSIYSTDGGQNYGKFSDPRVDKLFKQGVAELDRNKMIELSQQIDQLLWEGMATIPLYQKATYIAYRNTYSGISDNASSQSPFWNANTWAAKAA
jgi:peptide/nickel transport system substrate-binding protein